MGGGRLVSPPDEVSPPAPLAGGPQRDARVFLTWRGLSCQSSALARLRRGELLGLLRLSCLSSWRYSSRPRGSGWWGETGARNGRDGGAPNIAC